MEERVRPSRSGLIAIELVIAVGVFALCAAVSMGVFVRAELMSRESADLTRAVSEARSAAACYKAAGGDLPETAALLETGQAGEDGLTVAYDKDWTRTEGADPAYTLTMQSVAGQEEDLKEAELRVMDGEGEELLLWTVAAMEGVS